MNVSANGMVDGAQCRMQWRPLGTLLAVCVSAFSGWGVAMANSSTDCERMDSSELSSLDAHWVARMYGKVCDLGLMSSAAVIVDLARTDSSQAPVIVLSIDMPAQKSLWPKVSWESANKLVITLPSSANIALQMASYQKIAVEVRYLPSDPAERDTAGPEPAPPKPPAGRTVEPSLRTELPSGNWITP